MITDNMLGGIDDKNDIEIDRYYSKAQQALTSVWQSEEKIKLFIDDQELIMLFLDMRIKALELFIDPMLKYMAGLRLNNSKLNPILQRLQAGDAKIINDVFAERKKVLEDFKVNMLKGYEIIRPFNMQFQQKCKELLRKILSDAPRVAK